MPANPFTDIGHFLTATTGDYMRLGSWRYLILALFWVLLLAGIAIAIRNWSDPARNTSRTRAKHPQNFRNSASNRQRCSVAMSS